MTNPLAKDPVRTNERRGRRGARKYLIGRGPFPVEALLLAVEWRIVRGAWTVGIAILIVAALVAAVLAFSFRPSSSPATGPPSGNTPQCKGTAACFTDTVTYIVDGDTLDVGSTRIRLALVNSPEVGQSGYTEAKQFTARTCPVGTQALVDEDDGQTGGSYGRMVAVVYCASVNLNAALLSSGNAVLVTYYCSVSEFASEPWTGCP